MKIFLCTFCINLAPEKVYFMKIVQAFQTFPSNFFKNCFFTSKIIVTQIYGSNETRTSLKWNKTQQILRRDIRISDDTLFSFLTKCFKEKTHFFTVLCVWGIVKID